MRIAIVGAGPAGLCAAILFKQWCSDFRVEVYERNAADTTFGFGVVFSDQALAFLRADDPATADLIEPHMLRWENIDLVHRGERITIDGIGFSGIARLRLLALLRDRACALGVSINYGCEVEALDDVRADLIVGADGINSAVRASGQFSAEVSCLSNRFAWFGTSQPFDALTQTFIETDYGRMNAHHYSYAPAQSTFIIEMPGEVFDRTGFETRCADDVRRECARLFAGPLHGADLTDNRTSWRQFPKLHCDRWFDGNRVLVGDALHTAHFSIGSGTRLALEDVIALVSALRNADGDIDAGLPAYQAARQPVLEKLTAAAHASGLWYDAFDRHMDLDPWAFALSYIRRAGRLDAARLRAIAPRFANELDARSLLD